MRIAATLIAAAALWALPVVILAGPIRQGVTKADSPASSLAACEAAKERANESHCGSATVADKAVGACTCSANGSGWTCRVSWVEMCQTRHPAKSSRAVTSTHRGKSDRMRVDACYAARVEAQRHGCPGNTLARDVSACLCEKDDGTTSCLVDQTLWCHR